MTSKSNQLTADFASRNLNTLSTWSRILSHIHTTKRQSWYIAIRGYSHQNHCQSRTDTSVKCLKQLWTVIQLSSSYIHSILLVFFHAESIPRRTLIAVILNLAIVSPIRDRNFGDHPSGNFSSRKKGFISSNFPPNINSSVEAL